MLGSGVLRLFRFWIGTADVPPAAAALVPIEA